MLQWRSVDKSTVGSSSLATSAGSFVLNGGLGREKSTIVRERGKKKENDATKDKGKWGHWGSQSYSMAWCVLFVFDVPRVSKPWPGEKRGSHFVTY